MSKGQKQGQMAQPEKERRLEYFQALSAGDLHRQLSQPEVDQVISVYAVRDTHFAFAYVLPNNSKGKKDGSSS